MSCRLNPNVIVAFCIRLHSSLYLVRHYFLTVEVNHLIEAFDESGMRMIWGFEEGSAALWHRQPGAIRSSAGKSRNTGGRSVCGG